MRRMRMTEPLDYAVGDRAMVECTSMDDAEIMIVRHVLPDGSAILSSGGTVLGGVLFDSDGRSAFGFFQITKLIPKVENGVQRK
jgi:hypothetical protein